MKKEKKEQMNEICYPCNLFLKGYKYDEWYRKDQEKSKSQLEETIAERVKLRRRRRRWRFIWHATTGSRWRRSKRENRIKNLEPKQIIN